MESITTMIGTNQSRNVILIVPASQKLTIGILEFIVKSYHRPHY